MSKPKIPQTDSIQELAHFWDAHDLTDFEDKLEGVTAPVFECRDIISVPSQYEEAKAVKKMSDHSGFSKRLDRA